MLRKTILGACVALLGVALVLPVIAQEEMTADEVIAKNLEAKGGADKIAAMNSLRVKGKMAMGPGMEAPFTLEWKRPNQVRLEFEMQGQSGVQAYDGETAWMHMPFMGQAAPERMPQSQAKQVTDMSDLEGPLVNYKDKGHTVQYLGKEEVEGTEVHKLEVIKKNGDVVTFYLDADANLEIMSTTTQDMMGQSVTVNTSYGDYKEVDGLLWYHTIEAKIDGAQQAQTIQFESVEVNPEIDESRFAFPETEEETEEEDDAEEGGAE